MAYASRLLREQSIAKKSFVEVMPRCPLLFCLVGDRSVRQSATAPLLDVVVAPLPLSRSHRFSSPASLPSSLAGVLVDRAAARRRPHSRATSSAAVVGRPRLRLNRRRDCSPGRTFVSLEPPSALLVRRARSSSLEPLAPSTSVDAFGWSTAATSRCQ
ncbi:hypothetical protein Scep_023621 [Stephania cephalantha]|uniref:Uncharacterized protein n=1 Tax=Stephania cephalantha TaxID=152367 RepID=A0AAP0EV03_9MAGN